MDDKLKQVEKLILNNKKKDAVNLLYKMAIQCAKTQHFQKAEKFRKKILEIDSMALTEIIGAAEMIESEKAKHIDLKHKKQWTSLYRNLSDEQANDLYYSLKKIDLPPDKMVLQQGRVNNRLFFLNSGIIRIFCNQDRNEIYLKKVLPGEPFGLKSFFTISYATITAVTEGQVSLHYLERGTFNEIVEKHPGIDARIESLCNHLVKENIEDILKRKLVERRHYKRFEISAKVVVRILNADGRPTQTLISGGLSDLSQGGASFVLRQGKKETARLLLGRQASLKITPDQGTEFSKKGRVISVYDHLFNNYLVNFKFFKPLPFEQINALQQSKPKV